MPEVRISLQECVCVCVCVYDNVRASGDAEISADIHNLKDQRSLCSEQAADCMFQCYIDYCVL